MATGNGHKYISGTWKFYSVNAILREQNLGTRHKTYKKVCTFPSLIILRASAKHKSRALNDFNGSQIRYF